MGRVVGPEEAFCVSFKPTEKPAEVLLKGVLRSGVVSLKEV